MGDYSNKIGLKNFWLKKNFRFFAIFDWEWVEPNVLRIRKKFFGEIGIFGSPTAKNLEFSMEICIFVTFSTLGMGDGKIFPTAKRFKMQCGSELKHFWNSKKIFSWHYVEFEKMPKSNTGKMGDKNFPIANFSG